MHCCQSLQVHLGCNYELLVTLCERSITMPPSTLNEERDHRQWLCLDILAVPLRALCAPLFGKVHEFIRHLLCALALLRVLIWQSAFVNLGTDPSTNGQSIRSWAITWLDNLRGAQLTPMTVLSQSRINHLTGNCDRSSDDAGQGGVQVIWHLNYTSSQSTIDQSTRCHFCPPGCSHLSVFLLALL